MHVAGSMAENLELDEDKRSNLRLAGLLHDIGHGPFSHVSDSILRNASRFGGRNSTHEAISRGLIRHNPAIVEILAEDEIDAVCDTLREEGEPCCYEIVSGPLDADKQDYLLRDSHYCGVRYGLYDRARLQLSIGIEEGRDGRRHLIVRRGGLHSLEQFALARYYMTTQVYAHRVRGATDLMIERAIELGFHEKGLEFLGDIFFHEDAPAFYDDFIEWDDASLIGAIRSRAPKSSTCHLIESLLQRRLHKRVLRLDLRDIENELARSRLSKLGGAPDLRESLEGKVAQFLSEETQRPVDTDMVIARAESAIEAMKRREEGGLDSVVVLDRAGRPDVFENASDLFGKFVEEERRMYLEVFAPVTYSTVEERDRLLRACEDAIPAIAEEIADGDA